MSIKNTDKITTVKLSEKTKERVDKLRRYKRETYDDVLQHILEILNTCVKNPERARSQLIAIDKQRKNREKKEN